MQVDYTAILEKSVWDLLQYKKNGTIEEVLRIVMEALLKAEQKACLRLPVPFGRQVQRTGRDF